jgi:hypothetical protein
MAPVMSPPVRYLLTEASLHGSHPETIDVGALAR